MMQNLEFRKATRGEIPLVVEIYDSVRNGEFCVWSDSYPTVEDAVADEAAGCLYVLVKDGDVIGCASVEPVAEDDDLPFWRVVDGSHREISRIAIAPRMQGRGYARVMVSALISELEATGVSSVHLLAAKKNPPAYKTYRALGFEFLGECFRYGAEYFVCEKVLRDRA